MTVELFISILTVASILDAFLTQAIKKAYYNVNKNASPNLIALINSVVLGMGGTSVVYTFNHIPFSIENIIFIVLMGVAVWLGAELGYDKVIQLIKQLTTGSSTKNDE